MPTNDELARLIAMADELAQETRQLGGSTADTVERLGKRARTNRVLIYGLIGSFALDIMLTIVLAFGFVGLQQQSDRLDTITQRLNVAQTVQRQKALCPLYQVFLDSKSPEARARSVDPKKYDEAFKTIEDGYNALKCSEFKGGAPGFGR